MCQSDETIMKLNGFSQYIVRSNAQRKRSSKMLNKRERQKKIVLQICLSHLETINNVSLNMVSRIRPKDDQSFLPLEVS